MKVPFFDTTISSFTKNDPQFLISSDFENWQPATSLMFWKPCNIFLRFLFGGFFRSKDADYYKSTHWLFVFVRQHNTQASFQLHPFYQNCSKIAENGASELRTVNIYFRRTISFADTKKFPQGLPKKPKQSFFPKINTKKIRLWGPLETCYVQ